MSKMNPDNENYMYRMLFRLEVYKSSGDSFQQLISKVLFHAMPGFQLIQPYGNWGDGGNDGWIASDDHYFQVYGPKPTTQTSPLAEVKKAVDDFHKLPAKWGQVKKYSFVINDHFSGVPAPVTAALKKLKEDKNLVDAAVIGTNELMQLFMGLPNDIKMDIVGSIPSEVPDFIDPRSVKELLSYLVNNSMGMTTNFLVGLAPEFEEKIVFNGLSRVISLRLESNSYQVYDIDTFLDSVDTNLKQAIAKEVKDIYQQSKQELDDSLPDAVDLRYLWMMEKLIPPQIHESNNMPAIGGYRRVAELVLAKYFETCDVYEDPNSIVAA